MYCLRSNIYRWRVSTESLRTDNKSSRSEAAESFSRELSIRFGIVAFLLLYKYYEEKWPIEVSVMNNFIFFFNHCL